MNPQNIFIIHVILVKRSYAWSLMWPWINMKYGGLLLVNNLVDHAIFYIEHLQYSSEGSFIYDIIRLSYLIPIRLQKTRQCTFKGLTESINAFEEKLWILRNRAAFTDYWDRFSFNNPVEIHAQMWLYTSGDARQKIGRHLKFIFGKTSSKWNTDNKTVRSL